MGTQHIQINIPINFQQVIEIVKQLTPQEKQKLREVLGENIEVPEGHKKIVRQRIKKYENNPESYLSWNDIEIKLGKGK